MSWCRPEQPCPRGICSSFWRERNRGLPCETRNWPVRTENVVSRGSVMAFNVELLRKQVRPFRLHYFARLRSTNDHAARLRREKKLFAPSIVLTSRQLHGRGRGANEWWSGDPGCLTLTFVLPSADHLQPQQVPLIAGLAVRSATGGSFRRRFDPAQMAKRPALSRPQARRFAL